MPTILRYVIFAMFNSVIPAAVPIGHGTRFAYAGIGVVIHPLAKIGCRVLIGQGVTIGGREGRVGAPIIGDDVVLSAGSRILGPVTVGDRAIVGANAVVIADVPPGAIVAGVPARILRLRDP